MSRTASRLPFQALWCGRGLVLSSTTAPELFARLEAVEGDLERLHRAVSILSEAVFRQGTGR
jgi:hypothetical protein